MSRGDPYGVAAHDGRRARGRPQDRDPGRSAPSSRDLRSTPRPSRAPQVPTRRTGALRATLRADPCTTTTPAANALTTGGPGRQGGPRTDSSYVCLLEVKGRALGAHQGTPRSPQV